MARLALVLAQEAALPPAFGLLSHTVRTVSTDDVLFSGVDDDLLLVDGRGDLAAARDLCRRVQAVASPPVLLLVDSQALAVLTADWDVADFLLDGVQPGELDARIRLAQRVAAAGSELLECGPLVIDESAYSATVGGQPLELTYTEFELLKFLAMHPGRVLTRETLLSEVWGYDYYGGTRTVDVHIRRLRAKLGSEYDGHITTVRNVGYRFSQTR